MALSIIFRIGIRESSLIYSSYLVPDHGARERYSLSTNVNTPLFQVYPLKTSNSAGALVNVVPMIYISCEEIHCPAIPPKSKHVSKW